MYLQQLKNINYINNLSASALARKAGVTRAAVSRWWRCADENGWVNVETGTLMRLAAALGVPPSLLLQRPIDLSAYTATFLWDALYPSMEEFLRAVAEQRRPALARLVQQLGFADARRVAGNAVLRKFPRYKQWIQPTRRKELELLWPLYTSKT